MNHLPQLVEKFKKKKLRFELLENMLMTRQMFTLADGNFGKKSLVGDITND